MTKKKAPPKDIVEFGNILEYPFVYYQLISQTVAIYKSKIREIKNGKRKKGIPRHPRTLLIESFKTAKNKQNYDEKFLLDFGVPSLLGLQKSIEKFEQDMSKPFGQKKSFLGPMLYGVATDEYIDCEYQQILDRKKKGSPNHKCLTIPTLKKELKSVRKAMDSVFACDTAYGDCNNNSMASGHCMLASLVLQDLYGGNIKGGEVNGIPHYWNSFCHHDVDLTGDQFKKPPIQVKKGQLYKGGYIFKRDPYESMNQDFNKQVWSKHCKFRKRVLEQLKNIDKSLYQKLTKATKRLS